MASLERMSFLTPAHLICLEKTETHLVLCRYGEVIAYNSLNPGLTLDLLRRLRSPKTFRKLMAECGKKRGHVDKKTLADEVKRLQAGNFIYSYEDTRTLKKTAMNPTLSLFLKQRGALSGLSRVIEKSKIGVVDFGQNNLELQKALREVGFKHIESVELENLTKRTKLPFDHFIVVSSLRQRLYLSKLNQYFRANDKSWLLVTLDQFGGILGPTFGVPGGPCYDCIIDESKTAFGHGYRESQYSDLIRGDLKIDVEKGGEFLNRPLLWYAALESLKTLSGLARSKTYDGFFTFDLFNLQMDYSIIHPSPTCPTCCSSPE